MAIGWGLLNGWSGSVEWISALQETLTKPRAPGEQRRSTPALYFSTPLFGAFTTVSEKEIVDLRCVYAI